MNLDDAHRMTWRELLRQLGGTRLPLWAVVVLVAGLVVAGRLPLSWAMIVMAAIAAWSARELRQVAPSAKEDIRPHESVSGLPQAYWNELAGAVPDATLLIDHRKIILAANARSRSFMEVAVGQGIAQLRFPALLEAAERALNLQQATNFDLQTSVPVERHFAGTATPLPASAPDTPALLIVLRDRTEVEQLAEMRADFVANASHELRTPLASLKGFIETLQGAAKDDPIARERFLGIMQEQAGRMSRLIDDLLSLSRIEMSEHVVPNAVVDVAEIAGSTATAMQPIAAESGRHLTISLLAQPALVVGDRDQLAQVLQNLIQNAIKYGGTHGTVAVTVRRAGERIAVLVADDGIGISAEHLPRLTERFYRVSAKESRERGGTGLGLAIVKHIVNRHRGELKIESELGKGSTFSVVLPTASAPDNFQ